MAVLRHAYYQLSKSLNVVAAIIKLNRDSSVQHKCERHGGNRALSKEHRTQLWMEDSHFPPWAWVKEDIDMSIEALSREITKRARRDRCRVRIADLFGPDCAEGMDDEWHEGLTIVSDIARQPVCLRENGLPNLQDDEEITYFEPWSLDQESTRECGHAWTMETIQKEHDDHERQQRITAGHEHARRAVKDAYSSVPTSLYQGASALATAKVDGLLGVTEPQAGSSRPIIDEPLETQFARLASPSPVYVCKKIRDTERRKGTMYFLRSTPEQNAPFRGISSTAIHKVMREYKGYKLKSALETMALSPTLLWDILLGLRSEPKQTDEANHHACETHVSLRWELIRLSLCHINSSAPTDGLKAVDDIVLPVSRRDTQIANTTYRRGRRNSLTGMPIQGTDSRQKSLKSQTCCYTCWYHEFVDQSRRNNADLDLGSKV